MLLRRQLPVRRLWIERPGHAPHAPAKPCVLASGKEEERDILSWKRHYHYPAQWYQ
jgi:hypothetical protein